MSEKKQLQVEAIRNGSVIDHIPAGQGIKILKLFHLLDTRERITVGLNLPSAALVAKDLIKVENTLLTEAQAKERGHAVAAATVPLAVSGRFVAENGLRGPGAVKLIAGKMADAVLEGRQGEQGAEGEVAAADMAQ